MSENKKTADGWQILLGHILIHKKEVSILSMLGVISALANGTVPYILGRFFDTLIKPTDVLFLGYTTPLWLIFISLFIISQIIADIFDWRISIKQIRLGGKIFAEYRSSSMSALLYLPLSFHKNRKLGKISETIIRAAMGLRSIIEDIIVGLSSKFLSIIIGLSIAFYIHIGLALILITGVCVYGLTLSLITKNIGILIKRGNRAWMTAHSIAHESVSSIDLVKKFSTEKREEKRINNAYLKKAYIFWGNVELTWNRITFYQRIIVTATRGAIFILSIHLILNGSITIGELIAFNGYAMMFFGPFVILGQNWSSVQNGIVALEEVDRILNTPSEKYYPKDEQKVKIEGNISFKNVFFKYSGNKDFTLKGVNFEVKQGETVALVGESGVGKSTLIDLIFAFYFPQKGQILIEGVNIKKLNLNELRSAISIVPQETNLFNDTILNNLKYGSFKSTEKQIKKVAKEVYADVFIEKFPKKYKQIVGERGIKLSVGEKQRISIARAILRDPKILILDEPTSALDSQAERFITEALKKLMKGRTTFIIAHRLSTVRHADKILVFHKGTIIEEGKHNDLMKIKNGHYRKMYEMHTGLQ